MKVVNANSGCDRKERESTKNEVRMPRSDIPSYTILHPADPKKEVGLPVQNRTEPLLTIQRLESGFLIYGTGID